MQYTYARTLTDEELLRHLLAQDQLIVRVPGLGLREVERQVERLGFGEAFMVAETAGPRGKCCRIAPVLGSAFTGKPPGEKQSSPDEEPAAA
jgi:hypothetical protein